MIKITEDSTESLNSLALSVSCVIDSDMATRELLTWRNGRRAGFRFQWGNP
jgi:hypothetical protein